MHHQSSSSTIIEKQSKPLVGSGSPKSTSKPSSTPSESKLPTMTTPSSPPNLDLSPSSTEEPTSDDFISFPRTPAEIQQRLNDDPDYVHLRRFGYSVEKLLERYPDGCPDKMIAAALLITEEELATAYAKIVQYLRDTMEVE